MEAGAAQQTFITLSTLFLMFGIGTGLKREDFASLLEVPRAAAAGLSGQLLVLPVLGLLIGSALSLQPLHAAGLVLLCACPGGLASNMLTLMARADVALSVALTTTSTLLAAFTMPLWLLAVSDDLAVSPLATAGRIAALTLLPTLAGMALNSRAPALCERLQKPFRLAVGGLILLSLLGALARNRAALTDNVGSLIAAVVLLNLTATAAGALLGRLARLSRPQVVTVAFEVGLQNAPLALTLALGLGEPAMALPAILYGAVMMKVALLTLGAERLLRPRVVVGS